MVILEKEHQIMLQNLDAKFMMIVNKYDLSLYVAQNR